MNLTVEDRVDRIMDIVASYARKMSEGEHAEMVMMLRADLNTLVQQDPVEEKES